MLDGRTAAAGAGALAHVERVLVGTFNEPKIEAVRSAFAAYREGVRVEGVAVESGVPEQPVGFDEIVAGARNRARGAHASGPCNLAVGIEDGLVEIPGVAAPALNIGAAVVTDGRRDSVGLSSGFAYPPGCLTAAMAERVPIGDLFDVLWRDHGGEAGSAPSGRSVGNIGKLSLGALQRSEYGRHAVLCALLGFLHPSLYAPSEGPTAKPDARNRWPGR